MTFKRTRSLLSEVRGHSEVDYRDGRLTLFQPLSSHRSATSPRGLSSSRYGTTFLSSLQTPLTLSRDTAGQERFASLAPMYYRNAQSALVVYDLTKASSLNKAKHWIAELQRQASPGIVIALVGNKLDLVSDADNLEGDGNNSRAISTEEAKAYAEEEGLLFFETSAKTGENVQEVFEGIANAIPENALKGKGPIGGRSAGGSGLVGEGVGVGVDLNQPAKQDSCAC